MLTPILGLDCPTCFLRFARKLFPVGTSSLWVFTFNQNWKANLEGYLTNHSMREASFDALLMGMPGSDLASPSVRSFWKWNGLFTSFHWKPINRSILFRIQLTGLFFLITGRGRGYSLWWAIPGGFALKGCHFLASGIWKGRDFTSWSIWKGSEISHFGLWKDPNGLSDEFYGFTNTSRKRSFFFKANFDNRLWPFTAVFR